MTIRRKSKVSGGVLVRRLIKGKILVRWWVPGLRILWRDLLLRYLCFLSDLGGHCRRFYFSGLSPCYGAGGRKPVCRIEPGRKLLQETMKHCHPRKWGGGGNLSCADGCDLYIYISFWSNLGGLLMQ